MIKNNLSQVSCFHGFILLHLVVCLFWHPLVGELQQVPTFEENGFETVLKITMIHFPNLEKPTFLNCGISLLEHV